MTEHSLAIRQAIGVEKLGEIMWKSGYWQDTRSQAQAIVKILAGAELDIGPIASMNGVYVIEGRTSLAAQLIGSRIQASGRYRYRVVEHDDNHCVIDFFEIASGKREKLGTSSFSLEDAKKAELLGRKGGMWTKYPRNMVFSRALSNGAKWYTPDVFNGPVYTPDELGAEVNESGYVVEETPAQPYVPTDTREVQDAPRSDVVTSADDRYWQRWLEVRDDALKFGVPFSDISLPIERKQLTSAGLALGERVKQRLTQLDQQDAERQQHAAVANAWRENRELMEQAYAAGLRLRELPNNAALEEIEQRNSEVFLALEQLQHSA